MKINFLLHFSALTDERANFFRPGERTSNNYPYIWGGKLFFRF